MNHINAPEEKNSSVKKILIIVISLWHINICIMLLLPHINIALEKQKTRYRIHSIQEYKWNEKINNNKNTESSQKERKNTHNIEWDIITLPTMLKTKKKTHKKKKRKLDQTNEMEIE